MYVERGLRHVFEFSGLASNIRSFRDDMRDVMISNGHVPDTGTTALRLSKEIASYRDQAKTTPLTDIAFFLSLYSVFFDTQIPYLNIIGLCIAIIILIRGLTIEVMAYDPPDERRPQLDLEFRRSWNKGAVNGRYAPVGVPLIAIAMALDPKAYDIGIEKIGRIISEK